VSGAANTILISSLQPFNSTSEVSELALALCQRMWIANVNHALFFSEAIELLEQLQEFSGVRSGRHWATFLQ